MKRILVLFIVLFVSKAYCDLNLRIGMSWTKKINPALPLDEATRKRLESMANFTKIGSEVFAEWSNDNDIYIDGEKLNIELVIKEDDYTYGNIVKNYENMITGSEDEAPIDFFISGFGSEKSENAAVVTEQYGKVLISSSSTNESFSLNKTYSFSVFPQPIAAHSPFYPLYRLNGVNSVTFLKPINAPRLVRNEACRGFDEELAKNLIYNISYVYYEASPTAETNYTAAVDEVIRIDSDLLIYCDLESPSLEVMIPLFKEKDYTPRGALSISYDLKIDQSLLEFWCVSLTVSEDQLKYPEGRYIKDEDEYFEYYKKVTEKDINSPKDEEVTYKLGYFGAVAMELIVAGINASKSTDPQKVADYIRRNFHTSFIGEFSFDARNTVLYPSNSVQYVGKYANILAPQAILNGSLIYPMPTWKERVYEDKYSGIEIAVMVILAVCIINSIAWGIVIIIKRKEKNIVASSPIFLVCMLIGSVFIYVSLYFWTPNMKTSAGCSLHVAFLLFGFTLLFGSMLVKTWRVHLLFSRNTLEVFRVSNTQVGLFLSILLAVDLILFIVWNVLAKPGLEKVVIDEYRPKLDYYVCSTTNGGTALVWIMVGYHILLFLYGAYLALRVRTVPFKIYDESKIISFCIYNVGLVAIIVAIIEGASASSDRLVQFALRSFLIILSTAVTVNTMFIGKIAGPRMAVSTTSNESSSIKDSRFQSVDRSTTPSIDYEQECTKLKKVIKKLKAEIKEYKEALESLKDQANENS